MSKLNDENCGDLLSKYNFDQFCEILKSSNLTYINLTGYNYFCLEKIINIEKIKLLGEAFKYNSCLKTIILSKNKLDDTEIKIFCESIYNSQLYELNLKDNNISNEGIKFIADLLKNNKTIKKLNLCCNLNINEKGIKILCDSLKYSRSQLDELDLQENFIGKEGAIFIADLLKVNKFLQDLNLDHTYIYNEGIEYIAKSLETNKYLKYLDLSNNKIDKNGAKFIADFLKVNKSLKFLNLDCNNIGNNGVEFIFESKLYLNILSLCNNGVGDVGANFIIESLKINKSLKLYIYNNLIHNSKLDHIYNLLIINRNIIDKIIKECAEEKICFTVYSITHGLSWLSEFLEFFDAISI